MKKTEFSFRKRCILVFLVCVYLLCLYAGITGEVPFLQVYSRGNYKGEGAGYFWNVLGSISWLFVVTLIPDNYTY